MKRMVLFSALILWGCDTSQEEWAYYEHPQDAEVQVFAMGQCLTRAKGPNSTHYNDADEVVSACEQWADDVARYCPAKETRCLSVYLRTRADVRMMLPPKDTPQ